MRIRPALALGAAGFLLAACGSSGTGTGDTVAPSSAEPFATGSGSVSASSTAASATASSSASSGASSTPTDVVPSVTPSSGTPGSNGVPNVLHANDAKQQPVIEAGRGNPPNQLVIADLIPGSGQTATAKDTVTVQYVGADYATGQVFDSSYGRGQPATFPLNQVVPGFAAGIAGMKVGGRREIVIPPSLGYGDQAQGPIKANETLVFVVDLVSVTSS